MYFSNEIAKKCDAIRQKIENWKEDNKITSNEYYFLLATLLENIDKYANTASVYGAFLKNLKLSAKKDFKMLPLELIINKQENIVYNQDINSLIRNISGDIIYLDPPYNQRQYATNYHILEMIAKYDNPMIKGKTGLRNYKEQKSKYCSKQKAKETFKDLIINIKAKYIFLSYNNEGLMTLENIKEIIELKGEYGYFTIGYNRYKADNNRNYSTNKTIEYLHFVKCK